MKIVSAIAILSTVLVVAMGQPHRFLRSVTKVEPSEHLFPLLVRHLREDSATNKRALLGTNATILDGLFPGKGGENITNLPKDLDIQFRLFVLLYDVALFPFWFPLIQSGQTGGAGYDDLFRCVFGSGPFIPCLHENILISDEQFQCYKNKGLATECILLGNPFAEDLESELQADNELANKTVPVPGNRPRMLWREVIGYEFDRLLNNNRVWKDQLVNYNPHDALTELGFDRSLQQVSEDFFTGANINDLPKGQDFLLRIIVLTYDVALAPIWLPLIKIGGTGGATYQDLFFCVLDQGPFVPCLFSRNLISQENFDCYQTNGATWECLFQGNILFQQFRSELEQISATLFNETSFLSDLDGNSTRNLHSERSLHVVNILTEALQEYMGSDTYGSDGDSQWLPDLVSCLAGPSPYDKCVLGESIRN
jgi:hypothetical protein